MTDLKLDDIPDLVKSNKLTKQEACVQIYHILYTNPPRFGLHTIDEDLRSDFLLYFLQYKTNSLLEKYDPSISPFGAYIYRTVQTSLLTFIKKASDRNNYNKFFIQDSICDYQAQMQENENSLIHVASDVPEFSTSSKNEEIPALVYKQIFTKGTHRLSLKDSRERKIKRGILILALKSAWYISDSQINKVSTLCNISPKVLTDSVCKLKSKLINKALNRQQIENNRNRAYCFIHNYRMQLANNETDNFKFEQLQKKIDFQTENWNKKTRKLNSGRNKIAPTNSEIGEIIGLSGRFVSFYIRKLREMDMTTIQQFV